MSVDMKDYQHSLKIRYYHPHIHLQTHVFMHNTFHFVMHISIIKGIKLGFANLQTHKDQREIKECLHIQNTKQITIINLFNKLAAVAADASMGLQICGPMPNSFYNGNVHYKMEGVAHINLHKHIHVHIKHMQTNCLPLVQGLT